MDLQNLNDDQIYNRINRVIDGYATNTQVIRTNAVFRARINPPGEEFVNADQLWYPPPSAVVRPGRFNLAGQSMFYACARPHGALAEVRPKATDIVTLLICGAKNETTDINCAHIGLHRCEDDPVATGRNGLHTRSSAAFLRELKQEGVETKWMKIDDYLTELATTVADGIDEQALYRATNPIAQLMLRIPDAASLNYPSIATSLKCLNMCITPEGADIHFHPSECWMLEIGEHFDNLPGTPQSTIGYQAFKILKRSHRICADRKIVWDEDTTNLTPAQFGNRTWGDKAYA